MIVTTFNKMTVFLTVACLFSQSLYAIPRAKNVEFRINSQNFSIPTPSSIEDSEQDESHVYLLKGNSKSIKLFNKESKSFKKVNSSKFITPTYELDFSKLLNFPVQQFTVAKKPNFKAFYFSSPSINKGFDLTTLIVNDEAFELLNNSCIENECKQSMEGITAIRHTINNIIGDGQVTTIRDPNTGEPLLLTWDSENQSAHIYTLSNFDQPVHKEAFTFTLTKGEEYRIQSEGSNQSKFSIASNTEKVIYDLSQLRANQSIRRANALVSMNQEITGNTWTKKFMAMGLFGLSESLIDFIDGLYANAEYAKSDYLNDPVIGNIASRLNEAETFKKLIEHKILSESEAKELQREYLLNKSSGAKWFLTVGIVVTILGYFKIKSNYPSYSKALLDQKVKLSKYLSHLAKKYPSAAKLDRGIGRLQTKIRTRLIKGFYSVDYPEHSLKMIGSYLNAKNILTKADYKKIKKLPLSEQFKAYEKHIKSFEQSADPVAKADLLKLAKDRGALKDFYLVKKAYEISHTLSIPGNQKYLVQAQALYKKLSKVAPDAPAVKTLKSSIDRYAVHEKISSLKVKVAQVVLSARSRSVSVMDSVKRLFGQYNDEFVLIKINEAQDFVRRAEINGELRSIRAYTEGRHAKQNKPKKALKDNHDLVNFVTSAGREEMLASLAKINRSSINQSAYEKRINTLFDELGVIEKRIATLNTEGKVHPVYDKVRGFSQAYSRFFITDAFYKKHADNKIIGFMNDHARYDRLNTANGMQTLTITGEHVRAAFIGGLTDTAGEVITQTVARSSMLDPNERMFGSGDNYVEVFDFNRFGYDQELGLHFDMVKNISKNLIGWWLTMPIQFTRIKFGTGKKEDFTLVDSFYDGLKKKINPINFVYGQLSSVLPMKAMSATVVLADYKSDHAENFDEKKYWEFRSSLLERFFSYKAIGEGKILDMLFNSTNVTPQYFMVGQAAPLLDTFFGSTLPGRLFSSLVLPLTSGYFVSYSDGEYFGFNNSRVLKLLSSYNLKSIISKVDEDGKPLFDEWTQEEKQNYFKLALTLEVLRTGNEVHVTKNSAQEEKEGFFSIVGARLAGLTDNIFASDEYEYKDEVNTLSTAYEKLHESLVLIPVKKSQEKFMAGTVKEINIKKGLIEDLDSLKEINAKLQAALDALLNNGEILDVKSKHKVSLAVYDAIFLINVLLVEGKIGTKTVGIITNLMSNINQKIGAKFPSLDIDNIAQKADAGLKNSARKMLPRLSPGFRNKIKTSQFQFEGFGSKTAYKMATTSDKIFSSGILAFGSIPIYLWLDDQLESDTEVEKILVSHLVELQKIVFAAGTDISLKLLKNTKLMNTSIEEVQNHMSEIEKRHDLLKEIVDQTLVQSKRYLGARIYRLPRLINTSSLIGLGMSGAWLLTHYLAFKGSKGYISKMTDRFAPGLFKYSFATWITFGMVDDVVQRNIELSYFDFVHLFQAYQLSYMEKSMLEYLIDAHDNDEVIASEEELYKSVVSKMENDPNFTNYNGFIEKLNNLSLDVQ